MAAQLTFVFRKALSCRHKISTVAIGKIVMAARPTVYVVMAHEGDIFRCSLRYAG